MTIEAGDFAVSTITHAEGVAVAMSWGTNARRAGWLVVIIFLIACWGVEATFVIRFESLDDRCGEFPGFARTANIAAAGEFFERHLGISEFLSDAAGVGTGEFIQTRGEECAEESEALVGAIAHQFE